MGLKTARLALKEEPNYQQHGRAMFHGTKASHPMIQITRSAQRPKKPVMPYRNITSRANRHHIKVNHLVGREFHPVRKKSLLVNTVASKLVERPTISVGTPPIVNLALNYLPQHTDFPDAVKCKSTDNY